MLTKFIGFAPTGVAAEELSRTSAAAALGQIHRIRSREGRTADGAALQVPRQGHRNRRQVRKAPPRLNEFRDALRCQFSRFSAPISL